MSQTKAETAHRTKALPDGWRWVRLGDVLAESQPGFACGERDPSGVIQLRMNNVTTRGEVVWDEFIRVPTDDDLVERFRLVEGDIVFNNTNSTELVGKTALFVGHAEPVVYSNHFTRLRVAKDQADPRYIAAWLNLQWQLKVFENLCNRWIGQSAVKNDKLLALSLPLPSLKEQQRIAAILDEQMAAVERARSATEAQLEAAKALPVAYLRSVFDSPEAKGWPIKRVVEICRAIDYSFTASADFSIKEPRFLRITDIQNGGVIWDQVPGCQISSEEEVANRLADGDIVFARTGATTGKSFLVKNPPRAVFASYLIRLKPSEEIIADYLYAFFQSDSYWRQIRQSARGGAQPNVNATLLGAITLPVPPLSEQRRIAVQLSAQMTSEERLRRTLVEQVEVINRLPATLLLQAFSGEL